MHENGCVGGPTSKARVAVRVPLPHPMSKTTLDPVAETLRRWSRETTVEDLQRRGVSQLRSVSLSTVSDLIEKAVNRALLARTLHNDEDPSQEERHLASISEATREEFLTLVNSDAPQENRIGAMEAQAVSTIGQLQTELHSRRAEIAHQELKLDTVGGATAPSEAQMESKLRKLFVSWGGDSSAPSAMEKEVISLVLSELRAERVAIERERLNRHKNETCLLERRIEKLNRLLGESQVHLAAAQMQSNVDTGLASEYDSVQGLDPSDGRLEQKKALMSSIFEANRAMRDALN